MRKLGIRSVLGGRPGVDGLSVHRQLYRKWCEAVNSELIKATTEYYHHKLSDKNISPKDILQVANPLIFEKPENSLTTFENVTELVNRFAEQIISQKIK